MEPEFVRHTGETERDFVMKGLVMSATKYLDDLLLPPHLLGEEIETLSRADKREERLSGVFATFERER